MTLPPAYCLTLRQTPQRRALAEAEFARAGIEPVYLEGVHGVTWGLRASIPYEVDRGGTTPAGLDPYYLSPSHVGLDLSHWIAWTMAWHSEAAEVLVFEDDVSLGDEFRREFAAIRADLPDDWQMVYLGSRVGDDAPREHVGGSIWDVRFPLCTHAMLIRRNALPKLLESMQLAWAPIDVQLVFKALPFLRVYTVLPPLCGNRSTDDPEYLNLKALT